MDYNDNKQLIDELFRLFKKMMEKYPIDSIPGMNKGQAEQLRFLLSNYDAVKDNLSVEMFDMVSNRDSREMLVALINQLRTQLGEEAYSEPKTSEEIISEKEDETLTMPAQSRKEVMLKAIDEQLANGNLSTEEIDTLLDKRLEISNSAD